MLTTELIGRIRDRLLAGTAEQRNRLAANYTAGSGTLTLEFDVSGIGPGTRLSIGQSVFHVFSVVESTKVCAVSAGEDGSPDVSASSGTHVRVMPRFTDYRIFSEINNVVSELTSRGLFQMKRFAITYDSGFDQFEVTATDVLEPYAVRIEDPSTRKEWQDLAQRSWRFQRLADTTDFPSGQSLRIFPTTNGAFPRAGFKLHLLYKAPLTQLATSADDLTTTGLPVSAYDLPELGAYLNMALGRELKRGFTESQADPRNAEEVPPGTTLRAARSMQALFEARLQSEKARLHQQWPTRSR